MSNPEPRIERSARRHRAAIIGIIVALALAALALFIFAPIGGTTGEPGGPAPSGGAGAAAPPDAAVTTALPPAGTPAPATRN